MIYERKQKWNIICVRCYIFLYRYHHLKHSMTKTGSTSGAIEIILSDHYHILGTVLRAGEGGWWWRGESVQPNYRTEKVRFLLNRKNDFVLQVSSFRVLFYFDFFWFFSFFPCLHYFMTLCLPLISNTMLYMFCCHYILCVLFI